MIKTAISKGWEVRWDSGGCKWCKEGRKVVLEIISQSILIRIISILKNLSNKDTFTKKTIQHTEKI
jgi:hypothetical protein